MARPVNTHKLIREIAKEENIPISEVEKAVKSQFSYVAAVMASDTFAQVRLPYFGRFAVQEAALKRIEKYKEIRRKQ